jgi:hypothetical protein
VHFQALKRKMNAYRDQERRKLTDLTIISSKVLKDLQTKVDKAEKIVKLAEMNRKLETEMEKVVPFYQSSVDQDSAAATDDVPLDPEIQKLLPKEFPAMEQFNKRFNKVGLDLHALSRQRDVLREENVHLRSILRQYLDGISLNEDVLSQLNPLVVVNGRTNAPLRHPQAEVNVTCVEGSHHLAGQRLVA